MGLNFGLNLIATLINKVLLSKMKYVNILLYRNKVSENGLNMKHKKIGALLIALVLGATLTGCGTPLYSMTDEEYNLVVAYAAESVSKFNVYQNDGVVVIDPEELEDEEETESETEETTENSGNTQIRPGEGDTENSEATGDAVTITEALGLPSSISYTYKGKEVADHYSEPAGSVTADSGKTFVILTFTLEATEDTDIDLFSMSPRFTLKANGKETTQKVSLLTTDLATYIGTVKGQSSQDVVILFEMSEDDANNVSDFTLEVTVDSKTSLIKL